MLARTPRLSSRNAGDPAARQVGWHARRHTGIVDFGERGALDPLEYRDPIHACCAGTIMLDPDEFYILASREAVAIPADFAAGMLPFNPLVGEFRVHYAGFFDPGLGHEAGQGIGFNYQRQGLRLSKHFRQ